MSAPSGVEAPGSGVFADRAPARLLAGLFGVEVHSLVSPIVADPGALHPDELELVAKAVARRQKEFAQGRGMARALLAELGIEAPVLGRDADRVPLWPAGAVGCISHTKDLCAVAVALNPTRAGLGLDVEGAAGLEPELRPRICTPRERAWLAKHDEPDAGRYAKAFFSIKECVYKACFPTLRERWGFQDLEVDFDPAEERFIATPREGALAGRALSGRAAHRARWWFAAFELERTETPG